MKNLLPLVTLILLLGACTNTTKMQLRAPQSEIADTKTVKTIDSVKADTVIKIKK